MQTDIRNLSEYFIISLDMWEFRCYVKVFDEGLAENECGELYKSVRSKEKGSYKVTNLQISKLTN